MRGGECACSVRCAELWRAVRNGEERAGVRAGREGGAQRKLGQSVCYAPQRTERRRLLGPWSLILERLWPSRTSGGTRSPLARRAHTPRPAHLPLHGHGRPVASGNSLVASGVQQRGAQLSVIKAIRGPGLATASGSVVAVGWPGLPGFLHRSFSSLCSHLNAIRALCALIQPLHCDLHPM